MGSFLNLWLIPIIAFVPLVILLGGHRLIISKLNSESIANIYSIKSLLGLYVFSIFITYVMIMITTHQFAFIQLHFHELLDSDTKDESMKIVAALFDTYRDRHRSFGHGTVHGLEVGVMIGLFFIGPIAMMENWSMKKFRGYFLTFLIALTITGGVVCQFV